MAGLRRLRPCAFTLIELLVVVAIIALLISILLPSLKAARENARKVRCGAQQRQILTAARLYAEEQREFLPLPNWGWPRHSNDLPRGWLVDPDKMRGRRPFGWRIKDLATGALWGYLLSEELYRCPSHPRNGEYENDSRRLTSYLMNGAVGSFRPTVSHKVGEFIADAVIFWEPPDPEGLDEDESGTNPAGEDWEDGSSSPDQGFSYRHGNGVTLSYIDGHTEWVEYERYWQLVNTPIRNSLWCNPETEHGRWSTWRP